MLASRSIDESDPDSIINLYNIKWIKEKPSVSNVPLKTCPLLHVIITSIDRTNQDRTCEFLDRSGTIKGTIYKQVFKAYGALIRVGTVLVLKSVSVLMSKWNHYVNVSDKQLVAIYWSEEDGIVRHEQITQLSDADLHNLCETSIANEKTVKALAKKSQLQY